MKELFDFLQKWSNTMAAISGAAGASIALFAILSTYQPLATKDYVAAYVDLRVKPVVDQSVKLAATAADLSDAVNSLTVHDMTYQIIQLQQMQTRLQALINLGTATDSDVQLSLTIAEEIREDQQLRTSADAP